MSRQTMRWSISAGYILSSCLLLVSHGHRLTSGRLDLTSHVIRTFVGYQDRLEYRYTLKLTSGFSKVNAMMQGTCVNIDFSTSNYRLLLTWENGDSQMIGGETTSKYVTFTQKNSGWELDISGYNPTGKLLGIQGNVSVTPTADAVLGSKLQPILLVGYVDSANQDGADLIIGDYVYIPLPELTVADPLPPEIDSKENTILTQRLTLGSGSLGVSVLNVYVPNNVSISQETEDLYIEEPFMTVTGMQFLTSHGLTSKSEELLHHVTPDFLSNSKSSETDTVVFIIPQLQTASLPVVMEFKTEAESLDFIGQDPGIALVLCTVLVVGESFFLVKGSEVMLADHHPEIQRRPFLTISGNQMGLYATKDRTDVSLLIGLQHSPASWASVYNLSLILYLPPQLKPEVSLGKASDVLKASKDFLYARGDHVIEFEMKRLSFVHQLRLQFNISVDPNRLTVPNTESPSVLLEVVCSTWREGAGAEFAFSGKLQLKLPFSKQSPKKSSVCKCSQDGTASCTCNYDDVCDDDVRCVDCKRPWECIKTIPEHGMSSELITRNRTIFSCGPASRETKSHAIQPCVEIQDGKCIRVLPSYLGTILGEAPVLAHLYGVSRNGLAYLQSVDGGNSWAAMPEAVYTNASLSDNFRRATFKMCKPDAK